MAYTITDQCISCQRCLPVCPTSAITTEDGFSFQIDTSRCNNCESAYSVPQCWAVCPTSEGCVPLLAQATTFAIDTALERPTDYWKTEYWKAWFATYSQKIARLRSAQQASDWQQWFDTYARALQNLRTRANAAPNTPLVP